SLRQDSDIRAVEIPFRADRADQRKARLAVADRSDIEVAVGDIAGVADHKIIARAAEITAAAGKLPFRPDRADIGKGKAAVHHLADLQLARCHYPGVADQKPGVSDPEIVAHPLELPFWP